MVVKRRNPLDVAFVIRHRLRELGLEQRDLAVAAQVTESYISQLLGKKKAPPAPDRSDIYGKIERVLRLPNGELAKLADFERREEFKKRLSAPPVPLFGEIRELILRKCNPAREKQVRSIFEQQPFGELERLVTEKLLHVVKGIARQELENENWLHLVARMSNRSFEQMDVVVREFLDSDIFTVSADNCVSFLSSLIESWDIDLATFGMDIVLNHEVAPVHPKKFEFVEREPDQLLNEKSGFTEFLDDPSLSGEATGEEIEFLRRLRFKGKQPTALYYYRALQDLRDPLHFRTTKVPKRPFHRTQRGAAHAG